MTRKLDRKKTREALYDYLGVVTKDDRATKILNAMVSGKLSILTTEERVISDRVRSNLSEYL